jgi:hypothetical protein
MQMVESAIFLSSPPDAPVSNGINRLQFCGFQSTDHVARIPACGDAHGHISLVPQSFDLPGKYKIKPIIISYGGHTRRVHG